MNSELIAHEAHSLLQEVAEYEEPRLFLDEAPTLSEIAKKVASHNPSEKSPTDTKKTQHQSTSGGAVRYKGHIKDTENHGIKDRREAILSVIRTKSVAGIKDVSMVIREVSEKTIQRELLGLVSEGILVKRGERRWSTYSIA
jgi:hypothetical protein